MNAASGILAQAPLFDDLAEGPERGAAYWLKTSDGQRIRIGVWPAVEPRGTFLMFPGRTEYIEKYGRFAKEITAAGLTMLAVDWRGQGLADRPAHRRDMGYVLNFDEYARDVDAVVGGAEALGLPKPWYMLGHSMGGAIGLRALHNGLDVESAVFSAPMWGIVLSPASRAFAALLSRLSGRFGLDKRFTPTTGPAAPMAFKDNPLTHDRETFEYFERQTKERPELALGGPSIRWFVEALAETAELMAIPAPKVPAICFLGSRETIVDPLRIHRRMANWPEGKLVVIDGARHEVLMEKPEYRTQVVEQTIAWCR